MNPQGPQRPRVATIPQMSVEDLPGRVRDLEHGQGTLERGMADLTHGVNGMADSLRNIENTITVITTQRGVEDKAREHLMKIITGVAVGVSVAALGTLAGWVIHLQSAISR